MIRPGATALALLATQAAADVPRLAFPVDCILGQTCFIQNHVDRDPGPGYADFGCGGLSYDGHTGTDIALIDRHAMQADVDVSAAAPGRVIATRDGMPDILATDPGAPDLTDRSCGNAVVVDHGQGWQTSYCHLKQGSLRVRRGLPVSAGTVIGQVGLSGRTEFPHLHISLTRDGAPVDPFQPDGAANCGDTTGALWADDIAYSGGGLVSAGFAAALPDFAEIKYGSAHAAALPANAPALVLWGQVFGGRKGDVLTLEIDGPATFRFSRSILLKRTQARLARAAGRKLKTTAWPAGTYTGTVTLTRDGVDIDRLTVTLDIAR
ncbi:MAG: M23 family metallopeptidase [Rhodobacteraceae bacterium]|nr:M23 family metallopeptidase [Paracoccaceae bacterium]